MKTIRNSDYLRHQLLALVIGLGLALGATLSAADAKVDPSKLPPASEKKGLTFEKDVKPILEKSCLKCHSGPRPKGRYKVDTLENLLKGGREVEKPVVKGKGVDSRLIHYAADLVAEYEMPPIGQRDEFPKLTREQIGLLRAWIDQGAK